MNSTERLANTRPLPPERLREPQEGLWEPADGVWEWCQRAFLDPDSPLHNPEHDHLREAIVGVLWTAAPWDRQQVSIVGQAERPLAGVSGWKRSRLESQLLGWFGNARLDFLITLYAPYAMIASGLRWCAFTEHEMLHCGVVKEFGFPKYKGDGTPMYTMRGHDVEEFVSIWERYGAGAGAGRSLDLARALARPPKIGHVEAEAACGTCYAQVA